MNGQKRIWVQRRKRMAEIIDVGSSGNWISQGYDALSTILLLVNLAVTLMDTFDELSLYHKVFIVLEGITVTFFAIDYVLRIWTALHFHPDLSQGKTIKKYVLSFSGIVDLLSFLPYFLPIVFPAGAAAFRMFRVVRIFRLFQINSYYNSVNVITAVIASKKQQLLSSVFIILV